ncbi:methylcobalamin--homocysteine methyltransferase [Acidilobus saccharovorans]|nr:methylcobalamin--homocysteine methyltransferase [Acidilobus saccharovorans]
MKLWSMVLGGFPRTREARHALRDMERGAGSQVSIEWNVTAEEAAVIGVQEALGFRYVVDGMVDWHDIFRPFVNAWRNVAVSGLLRYFDNNFFYRVPVFTDRPDPDHFVWPPRIRAFSNIAEPSPLKAVIPGPLTFLLMSKNASELSKEDLAESIASALAMEAQAAEEAGAALIQIDEPYMTDQELSRDDAILGVELINSIVSRLKVPTVVSLYFDVAREDVYEALLNIKATYISIDVADAPTRALSLIAKKGLGGHKPILGVIDARRIESDDFNKIKDWALQVSKEAGDEEIGLTTTTWFDVIPYTYSLRKAYLLSTITERLGEVMSQ